MKEKKVYLFIIGLLIVIVLIILIFNRKEKDYIYLENGIPIINVDNTLQINQTIEKLYNDKSNAMEHKIYMNTNIYSLVLDIDKYSSIDDEYLKSYVSYNIDLATKEILTKEQLLEQFNFSKKDLLLSVQNLLKTYYDEEVQEGYIESNECSFNDYVLYIRQIENIYDETVLFVKNNELYGYIPFHKNSLFDDSEYFLEKKNIFEFKLKEG